MVSLGYLPFSKGLIINERHLGLVTVEDYGNKVKEVIKHGLELMEGRVNLDLIYELAEP